MSLAWSNLVRLLKSLPQGFKRKRQHLLCVHYWIILSIRMSTISTENHLKSWDTSICHSFRSKVCRMAFPFPKHPIFRAKAHRCGSDFAYLRLPDDPKSPRKRWRFPPKCLRCRSRPKGLKVWEWCTVYIHTLHYITLHCILYYILYYITLHYITLHTVLRYIGAKMGLRNFKNRYSSGDNFFVCQSGFEQTIRVTMECSCGRSTKRSLWFDVASLRNMNKATLWGNLCSWKTNQASANLVEEWANCLQNGRSHEPCNRRCLF